MADARYYAGYAGRQYVYARDARIACPWDPGITPEELDAFRAKVAAAGLDVGGAFDVERTLRRAHGSGVRRDEKDPTRCARCGAELVKIGYPSWVEDRMERAIAEGYLNEATERINQRLGSTHVRVPASYRLWATKREAMNWAREEAEIDRRAGHELALAEEES